MVRRRIARHSLLAAIAAAALLGAPAAHADVSASDRETARSMMAEGRELRDKGDLKSALQRFKTADAIMHVPTTGLEVAKTQVALGLYLEARDTVAAIRKLPQGPNDPAPFADARSKADDIDASVESKIPSITITVGGTSEGETPAVSIDGQSVPPSVAGLPRKVNPGHHTVMARGATGEASQEVDVAEGEKKQVQLVLSSGGGGGETPAPPSGDQTQNPPKETASNGNASEKQHSPTPITWVGIVAGGAGIVAGSVAGIISMSKTSGLKSECPGNKCPPGQGQSDLSTAQTTATISTVGFIVGIAGAGVAVATLLIGHDAAAEAPARTPTESGTGGGDAPAAPPPAPESSLHVTPWIGLGSAGVFGTF